MNDKKCFICQSKGTNIYKQPFGALPEEIPLCDDHAQHLEYCPSCREYKPGDNIEKYKTCFNCKYTALKSKS